MKYKTTVWRPFRKENYAGAWHDQKLLGVLRELGRDARRCHERIWRGYCDYDLFSIDAWFLKLMPTMLEDFKDQLHGCPPEFATRQPDGKPNSMVVEPEGMQAWKETLERMSFLLREADEEACTRKNPYEAEYASARADFEKKYGMFGEKLMTEEEKEAARNGQGTRWYFPHDVPEYQQISKKYMEEENTLAQYRCACKDEALALFSKWFYVLWD